jgi:hypothetical protein
LGSGLRSRSGCHGDNRGRPDRRKGRDRSDRDSDNGSRTDNRIGVKNLSDEPVNVRVGEGNWLITLALGFLNRHARDSEEVCGLSAYHTWDDSF